MRYDEAPAWLKAADAHAIAAGNTSIFEDLAESVANAPSFLAVSIASGLNSFYNTGITIGNLFLDEDNQMQLNDTGEWISSFDEDLGKYYEQNKDAADLVGFIAGSLVPGMAAVKGLQAAQAALRAAQAGQVGKNMSLATRLLAPSMETYVKREAADLAARSASFSFMHQNSLKALAAGAQQGVLESLAFETAVAATMFKSPLLEDMDFGDIIKNGLTGVAFGAGVGGIFSAAKTYFDVGKLLKRADNTASLFQKSTQTQLSREHLPSDAIINAANDLEILMKTEATPEFVLAAKIAAGETGESLLPQHVAGEVARLNRLREANMQTLQNEIRTKARGMASDDVLGNQITDVASKLGPDGLHRLFFGAKEIVRAGEPTQLSKYADELVMQGEFPTKKKALEWLAQEHAVDTKVRLHSGTVGEQISGKVGALRIADVMSPEQLERALLKTSVRTKDFTDFRKIGDLKEAQLRWMATRASTLPLKNGVEIGSHDLPMLEKALKHRGELEHINLKLDGGEVRQLPIDELEEYIVLAKSEVILAQKEAGKNSDVIEILSDVRKEFIEGTDNGEDIGKIFFAQRSYAKEASEFHGREISELELAKMPTFAKVTYDTRTITDETGMVLKGMALIKHREKLAKQATDNYFASYAGKLGTVFPDIDEALFRSLWRGETGAGLATNAGGAYGSMSSMASYIGNLTSELRRMKTRELTEAMTPAARGLLTNQDDAVRFSSINAYISNTPVKYVMDDAGEKLIPYQLREALRNPGDRDYEEIVDQLINTLPSGTLMEIPLENQALRDAVMKHIELDTNRLAQRRALNAVQGNTDEKLEGVFRPIRPNPDDYPFIAFVKDEKMSGVGHTAMLFANTAADLEAQIAKVNELGTYKVYTKKQAEDFYRARGDYEYDKTIHENYVNTDLQSRGIASNFLPPSDPSKIVDQWVQHHMKDETALLRQSVLIKYEKETNELKRLADQWNLSKGSRIGYSSVNEMLTAADKNPYSAMLKAMLDITKVEEFSAATTLNQALDTAVSKAWNAAAAAFGKGRPTDADVERVNKIFDELGFRSAYQDAATMLLANSQVPRGVLSKFVRKSNAFLTTTMLRWDVFNTINNLVGNSVLYSAELKNLTNAIKKGDATGAGELAKLAGVAVPGVDDVIFSPNKLFANSIKRLFSDEGKKLMEEYKLRGLIPDLGDQIYKALDPMTLSGTETLGSITSKMKKLDDLWEEAAKAGEKWTGNKFAEEFNRFLAIDAIKQVADVAVAKGIIDEKASWMYVNTFNNRVNGVIRAAERPLMFQGPIGQAMGLFQSYQMNLLQQVFRNIGEGRGKTLALMAGMQGTVFGASSLPGFHLINSTLVGQASGNPEHYDLYSATQTIFGQKGADWIMYGAPSNILRASLYTRGDTNPRTWHVVPNPTNPSEIPFISAYARAFSSIKEAASQVAQGAPLWESFLHGIEHLGLSRPLAGLAATARGLDGGKVYSTQANGSISGSNDLFSLATLVRLAGAKPIDEAIATNSYFRINAYAEADRKTREALGTGVKLALAAGKEIPQDAIANFAEKYVAKGGSATGFNQWWMNQYKNATMPQTVQMVQKLDDPYARRMMEVMGGRDSLFDLESF